MKRIFYPLGMATLLGFFGILLTYASEPIERLDARMDSYLYGNGLLDAMSFFGGQLVILSISVLFLLYLWIRERDYRGMLFVFFAVGAGNALNQALKFSFERQRPDLPHGLETFSFPSGHAMMGILYLLTLAYFITSRVASRTTRTTIWGLAVVFAIVIGLSRVAGGEHYFSDVLAGWFLGYSWFVAVAVWYEWRTWQFRNKR